MSDSLIRLFPEQFWFEFGVLWTVGILVQGVILALVGYGLQRWELGRAKKVEESALE